MFGWIMPQPLACKLKGAFPTCPAALQGAFRGRVYGPILLEVSVQDGLHARILENHFGGECLNHSVMLPRSLQHLSGQDNLR
jgi:hypothetical protein